MSAGKASLPLGSQGLPRLLCSPSSACNTHWSERHSYLSVGRMDRQRQQK